MKRSISKKSLAALAVPLALLYLRRSHSKRKSEAAKKRTAPRLLGGALGSFLAGGVAGYGVGRRRPDVGRAVNDSEARTDDLSGAHDGETPTAGYISDAIQQTLGSLPGRRKKKRKNARILRRPTTRVGRHGSQYDSDNNSSWSTKWAETRQQMTLPTPPMYRRRRRIIEKLRDVARNTVYFDLSGEDTEPVSEYETDWAAMIGASGGDDEGDGMPSEPASSSSSWQRNTPINPLLYKPTSIGVSFAPNVVVSGGSTEKMRKKLEARRA